MDIVSGVGVIDKGVALLRAMAEGPADLHVVQQRTGLPRATAHRLLLALELHGLVRRDSAGRFYPGWELVRLGAAATSSFPLADAARPVLAALRDRTGESAQLYVVDGDMRRCVVSLPSPHALRWTVPEGSLLPMDKGSAGKVLSGAVDLAESVEEREPGVASVSAAIRSDGLIVAATGISGPVERLTRHPARRFGADVRGAAEELSRITAGMHASL